MQSSKKNVRDSSRRERMPIASTLKFQRTTTSQAGMRPSSLSYTRATIAASSRESCKADCSVICPRMKRTFRQPTKMQPQHQPRQQIGQRIGQSPALLTPWSIRLTLGCLKTSLVGRRPTRHIFSTSSGSLFQVVSISNALASLATSSS